MRSLFMIPSVLLLVACEGGSDRPDLDASTEEVSGGHDGGEGGAGDPDAGDSGTLKGWQVTELGFGAPAALAVVGDVLYWLETEDRKVFQVRKTTLPWTGTFASVDVTEDFALLGATEGGAYVASVNGSLMHWTGGETLEKVWEFAQLTTALAVEEPALIAGGATGFTYLPLANSEGAAFLSAQETRNGVALEPDGAVYWIDAGGYLVRYMGGERSRVVQVPPSAPEEPVGRLGPLAQRDEHLYFIVDRTLFDYDQTTSELAPLADVSAGGGLWLRDEYGYWFDPLTNTVLRAKLTEPGSEEVAYRFESGNGIGPLFAAWRDGFLLAGDQGFVFLREER